MRLIIDIRTGESEGEKKIVMDAVRDALNDRQITVLNIREHQQATEAEIGAAEIHFEMESG